MLPTFDISLEWLYHNCYPLHMHRCVVTPFQDGMSGSCQFVYISQNCLFLYSFILLDITYNYAPVYIQHFKNEAQMNNP